MIIAVPLDDSGAFSPHFGGSVRVGIYEVDPERRILLRSVVAEPPEGGPCSWAGWLRAGGVALLIANGMGPGARERMAQAGIEVILGAPVRDPAALVREWLDGGLVLGAGVCEGGHHGHGSEGCDSHHGCGSH